MPVEHVDAAVGGGGAEHDLAHEVRVGADHRRHEAAAAARQQVDGVPRVVVRQQRGDRPERLDLVHRGRGGIAVQQQHGRQERAALEARQVGLRVTGDDLAALRQPGDGGADGVALRRADQRAHPGRRVAGVADDDLRRAPARSASVAASRCARGTSARRTAVHFCPALAVISRTTSRTNRSNSSVPGPGVGAEHGAVQRVRLGGEAHPALGDRRVRPQRAGRWPPTR